MGREEMKVVKTGDGGRELLMRETNFRNRLGSYDINMNRRAIKDMFGRVSETLFGAGGELEEVHGVEINQEDIERDKKERRKSSKRSTKANTFVRTKDKNAMRDSGAKKVSNRDKNALRSSDAAKLKTHDKNQARKSDAKGLKTSDKNATRKSTGRKSTPRKS